MPRSIAITLTLCLATATAQAALLGRMAATLGGTDYRAYYDDVQDITWMADANLAATSVFGVAGIVPDGRMTWDKAQEWIGAMNATSYLGASNWRLPTVTDTGAPGCEDGGWYSGTDCGYNVDASTGEMAHLYYSTLGNVGYFDTNGTPIGCANAPNYCLTNPGPFSNFQIVYWMDTNYAPIPGHSWRFDFTHGYQGFANYGAWIHAWAVSPGDVTTVPIPPAVWLFGSALGLMGWMRRKLS